MATLNPYLVLNGNCEKAFTFYSAVFGKKIQQISKFKDMPGGEDLKKADQKLVMHVVLPISKETVLMGSDANPAMGKVVVGQHLSLSVGTESKKEADKIFSGLAKGGKVTMPIGETFWGAYFGMLTDKFGVIWMVNYDKPAKKKK